MNILDLGSQQDIVKLPVHQHRGNDIHVFYPPILDILKSFIVEIVVVHQSFNLEADLIEILRPGGLQKNNIASGPDARTQYLASMGITMPHMGMGVPTVFFQDGLPDRLSGLCYFTANLNKLSRLFYGDQVHKSQGKGSGQIRVNQKIVYGSAVAVAAVFGIKFQTA